MFARLSRPILAAASSRALASSGAAARCSRETTITPHARLSLLAKQSRALASGRGIGVATKSGVGGEGLTTATPEARLSMIARLWARTRDAPEVLVMYFAVAAALSMLAYTLFDPLINTRRGAHLAILVDPNVRGSFDAQLDESTKAADASAKAAVAAVAPAGGSPSMWYRLGHVRVDEQGPNVSIPPFNNRKHGRTGADRSLGAPHGSPPSDAR